MGFGKIDYSKKFPDRRKDKKTLLKKIQHVELRILKIFDDICQRNNISYSLLAGTLLGADEYKGFIPWDDDVDVIMPREDFEKFSKIAKNELPEDLFWQDIHTDNFPHFRMLFGKIRDKSSRMEKNNNYNTGVFMDVFILEKVSTNKKIAKIQKKYLNFLCHLDLLKNRKSFVQQIRVKKIMSKNPFFKKGVEIFASFSEKFLKLIDIPTILRKRYYKKIDKKDHSYYWYTGEFTGKKTYLDLDKKDIFPLKKIKFEDSKFDVFRNHQKFIKMYYGKFVLPPKHLRKPGHIEVKETYV